MNQAEKVDSLLNASTPKTIYLKDYQVPDYLIKTTDLRFDIFDGETQVTSLLQLYRNPQADKPATQLTLYGVDLELLSIALNEKKLTEKDYSFGEENLTVFNTPEEFSLLVITKIKPENNTSLEGLYKSRTMYCTQCEAEGFRKITYYLDRPDVMSEFTTTVVADKKYPVLLSNGNLIDSGDIEPDGMNKTARHFATWHDPFKKPCYLFALVAGDLSYIQDEFVTASGRKVDLKIYVEPKDLDKCDHAMQSLKNAMRWDEQVYGREYDLDIFMIVAVDDFNMGAMENKGLNIFNTSCVLAKPETTTDLGFQRVEGVVAHEYFHNWSGNRVTCRDWFQLSLKEGFTVYRDSEFSADMGSRTVKRVEDVTLMRTLQFAEDASPMAHPIRPASYIEISNFYTMTVYEKGAEVIRMLATLLGPEKFRRGTDLYFDRHDGQAVTTDDFVKALEDASQIDLTQFKHWYSQAGTPRLTVTDKYDAAKEEYCLTIKQNCPPTPDSLEGSGAEKLPFHIPIAMGLLGKESELPLSHRVLELKNTEQTFVFESVKEKPVPSLLRGFSAPVKLDYDYTTADLMRIMTKDSVGFNRWDASQKIGTHAIHKAMAAYQQGQDLQYWIVDQDTLSAYLSLLQNTGIDKAMLALMLTLPSEAYLSEISEVIHVEAIFYGRLAVRRSLAKALQPQLQAIYSAYNLQQAYSPTAEAIAARSLKNTALGFLMLLGDEAIINKCHYQFKHANNMTDQLSALTQLVNADFPLAQRLARESLADFYQQWQSESLVMNQWLSVQANCVLPNTLDKVKSLLGHPGYDGKNPNKIRALVSSFCNNNAINFHMSNGDGYHFLKEQVIHLNSQNPQIASRLLSPLVKWKKYDAQRQKLMRNALEEIQATPNLSKDVFEVVSKSLVVN
jgi:aminopeptidase N